MDTKKLISDYMEAHREEFVSDICELMRIDSTRGEAKPGMPFGEGPAAALKKGTELIEKYGFVVNNCDNYAIDTKLNDGELAVDVLAHLDVVPAGDGWSVTDPFEPLVKDGKIYGRGSADDKGPAMAGFYAMRAIRDLGLPMKKNVRLILGSDEECGSSDIAYYFKKESHAPATFSPDADFPLIFFEKGHLHATFMGGADASTEKPRVCEAHAGVRVNVVPSKAFATIEGMTEDELRTYADAVEKTTKTTISFTEKENNEVEVLVEGKGAHAAGPMDGNNALTALLQFLASLPLAESLTKKNLQAAAKLFPHGDFYGAALGVNHEDEISGKLTLTLDMFTLNADGMQGTFDCRACNCATDENTRQVIYRKFEEAGFDHDDEPLFPPHYVPKDSPLVKTLMNSYTSVSGKGGEPLAIGGGTYVHNIDNGVAFGCADPSVDNVMHGANEFAVIDQLVMSACVFADALLHLCND